MEASLLRLKERITLMPKLYSFSSQINHENIVRVNILRFKTANDSFVVVFLLLFIIKPRRHTHICIVDWQLVFPSDVVFELFGVFVEAEKEQPDILFTLIYKYEKRAETWIIYDAFYLVEFVTVGKVNGVLLILEVFEYQAIVTADNGFSLVRVKADKVRLGTEALDAIELSQG